MWWLVATAWGGTVGEVEVLAVNARAALIRERITGEVDCKYPGLPPNTGEGFLIAWRDGLVEHFTPRPSDCATPAQTQREEALLASVRQRSGLTGGSVTWKPFVQRDRDNWSVEGGPSFEVLYQQRLSEVLSVGGRTVGGWAFDRPDELPVGFRSLTHRPIGVGSSGSHHVAVFSCGYGEDAWVCALPFDDTPTELRLAKPSDWGRVEIQAVDLERGLIAYREFTTGTHRCAYPGLDPNAGVTLGICSLRGECEERVIYAAATEAGGCTPQDVAVRALEAAKARSAELGLDRTVGGLSGCRTVALGAPTTIESDGKKHTVEIQKPERILWDGKLLERDMVHWSDPLPVCVDHGWALVGPNPYVNGLGKSILAVPFPVSSPPLQ